MNISENIKRIREGSGLSQEQVAEKMNTSQSSYARIESGRKSVDFEDIMQFSKAVNMNILDVVAYPDVVSNKVSTKKTAKVVVELELDEDDIAQLGLQNKLIKLLKK